MGAYRHKLLWTGFSANHQLRVFRVTAHPSSHKGALRDDLSSAVLDRLKDPLGQLGAYALTGEFLGNFSVDENDPLTFQSVGGHCYRIPSRKLKAMLSLIVDHATLHNGSPFNPLPA